MRDGEPSAFDATGLRQQSVKGLSGEAARAVLAEHAGREIQMPRPSVSRAIRGARESGVGSATPLARTALVDDSVRGTGCASCGCRKVGFANWGTGGDQ